MYELSIKLNENITQAELQQCSSVLDNKVMELNCLNSLLKAIYESENIGQISDLTYIAMQTLEKILEDK